MDSATIETGSGSPCGKGTPIAVPIGADEAGNEQPADGNELLEVAADKPDVQTTENATELIIDADLIAIDENPALKTPKTPAVTTVTTPAAQKVTPVAQEADNDDAPEYCEETAHFPFSAK